jgi:hypothetical protein
MANRPSTLTLILLAVIGALIVGMMLIAMAVVSVLSPPAGMP